jgi:hypothetical protein
MTQKAEGTKVVQVALSSPLGYGKNVVSVPQAAAAGDGLHAVEAKSGGAGWTTSALESRISSDSIDVADGASAPVAAKHLIAEIARIGAKTPLVDAVLAAKSATAFSDDLKLAPAA